MNSDEKYLSKEKHADLKEELAELKTTKRREIAEQLEFAKSLGDLSENAEYHEARESQAGLEERILTIEDLLKRAVIVSNKQSSVVNVGSKVALRENSSGSEQDWNLVGSEESDLSAFKISNESPLGSSLMGKKMGDKVEIDTPKGRVVYIIKKID